MIHFALIGASGYIAPRHMHAIRDTGNNLLAAFDTNDSVGVLDDYFPDAFFFTEFERFDRFVDKQRREGLSQAIEYVSICSPNYLHDAHIRFALRSGANAICEKPVVLNPWNIDALSSIEQETGKKVFTMLQLRLHPSIIKLKKMVEQSINDTKYDIELTNISPRGKWYFISWKGDTEKSGGITTNIGVHFFDMLHFIFGKLVGNQLHYLDERKAGGYLEFEKARVRWFLSLDINDMPVSLREQGKRTCRKLSINGTEIDFSEGFTNLHTHVYEDILAGRGFRLEDNRAAIETVALIRNSAPTFPISDYHPLLHTIKR